MLTRPWNLQSLTPEFQIVKLGFKMVYVFSYKTKIVGTCKSDLTGTSSSSGRASASRVGGRRFENNQLCSAVKSRSILFRRVIEMKAN